MNICGNVFTETDTEGNNFLTRTGRFSAQVRVHVTGYDIDKQSDSSRIYLAAVL